MYKFPIKIKKLNELTEEWDDHFSCRSNINRVSGKETFFANAIQSPSDLTFKVRYCSKIKEIFNSTQLFRIEFDNELYNITSYDDFKLKHQEVTLLGASINA